MNKKLFSLVAGATLLASSAFAKTDTWYVSAHGGLSMPTKLKEKDDSTSHSKFKTGYNVGGAVGYSLDDWRFELETGYHNSKIKRYTDSGAAVPDASGHFGVFTIMGNVFYDIPVVDQLDWTVGAGLGWAHFKTELTNPTKISGHANCFAYQFMTGPVWNINDNWSVSCLYSLLSYSNPNAKISGGTSNKVKFKSNYINSLKVGVRYSF